MSPGSRDTKCLNHLLRSNCLSECVISAVLCLCNVQDDILSFLLPWNRHRCELIYTTLHLINSLIVFLAVSLPSDDQSVKTPLQLTFTCFSCKNCYVTLLWGSMTAIQVLCSSGCRTTGHWSSLSQQEVRPSCVSRFLDRFTTWIRSDITAANLRDVRPE